jgi:hypothetical protein
MKTYFLLSILFSICLLACVERKSKSVHNNLNQIQEDGQIFYGVIANGKKQGIWHHIDSLGAITDIIFYKDDIIKWRTNHVAASTYHFDFNSETGKLNLTTDSLGNPYKLINYQRGLDGEGLSGQTIAHGPEATWSDKGLDLLVINDYPSKRVKKIWFGATGKTDSIREFISAGPESDMIMIKK